MEQKNMHSSLAGGAILSMEGNSGGAITSLSAKITAGAGLSVAGASGVKTGIDSGMASTQGVEVVHGMASWGLAEWGIVFGASISLLAWLTQFGLTWYFGHKRLEIERARTQQIVYLAQANSTNQPGDQQ